MPIKLFTRSKGKKDDILLEQINSLESGFEGLNDDEIKERSLALKDKVFSGASLDEILPEAFALVRESAKRTLNQRHFDTQILGGISIHKGKIAEMMTGEGKTLAVTAPVYLNALTQKGVHVITVNDYLASRDAVWMGQIYYFLGLKTACLTHEGAFIYDPDFSDNDKLEEKADKKRDESGSFLVEKRFLRPVPRKQAYEADITYGTNHEFGFDYLRDNLAQHKELQVQRGYNFAVIDEVDSVLIDEARTPLIISSPDMASSEYYKIMSKAVLKLSEGEDYVVDEKLKSVEITEPGIDKVEKYTGISDLFSLENIRLAHYLEECLKAKTLFIKDRNYVVRDGEVVIVDQFTGRLMHGRRYSGGLHQAIEAKEGVKIQEESRTFAQVTIQNYFKLYSKLAGMTGTAQTSAEEFHKVYGLDVVTIPTNKPVIRKDLSDLIYKTIDAKFKAVAEEAKKRSDDGQPVLIGTVSIEKNELLSKYLDKAGVRYEVLNAKNHEREGSIIAQAGRSGSVTLATNMAGRGVDIILGGSPYDKEKAEEVKNLGGLHVIGTERHEARRIDNQLRGRAGRQGDPGSSRFFVSLEDDLMRIFGGARIGAMMQTLNIPEDQPIESKLITKALVSAQKKVEGMNFDSRKHLLEYDNILNKQRMAIYKRRQDILTLPAEGLRDIAIKTVDEKKDVSEEDKDKIKEAIRRIENPEAIRKPMLGMLDNLWMNHLEDLESLSESVRIRAYGQHDPLVEYRRESHILYSQLLHNFEDWLYDNLSRIPAEAKKSADNNMLSTEEAANSKSTEAIAAELNMTLSELSKVGRNDPCPCGAKKEDGTPVKFKHCHGK
ncbi:MAG: preprotein translocase subunit SecA [Candidatus Paceibacterota bacterium]